MESRFYKKKWLFFIWKPVKIDKPFFPFPFFKSDAELSFFFSVKFL